MFRIFSRTSGFFSGARGIEPLRKRPVPRVSFHAVRPSLNAFRSVTLQGCGARGVEPRPSVSGTGRRFIASQFAPRSQPAAPAGDSSRPNLRTGHNRRHQPVIHRVSICAPVATGGTSRRPRLILSFQTGPSRAFFVSLYARSRSNTLQIYRISVTNKNKFRKYGAFREDFN